jgi:hypothetical protein
VPCDETSCTSAVLRLRHTRVYVCVRTRTLQTDRPHTTVVGDGKLVIVRAVGAHETTKSVAQFFGRHIWSVCVMRGTQKLRLRYAR